LEDSVFQSFSHELRGADKPIAVLTYDELERWIHSLQDSLSTEGFTYVIGILRGGAPLALMVSHSIGVPVVFLRYERSNRTVKWDSCLPMPPAGSKVLLCEDIAGSGHTLADCNAFLQGRGLILKTLTAAYDELSRIRPDYGIDAVGYFPSFPWERHAYTDAYRADWARTGAGRWGELQQDNQYTAVAVDLDNVPLAALPDIESDNLRVVVMRSPESCTRDVESLVKQKVTTAVKFRCTVFIEGDLQQAILISERAPLLKVVWWDVTSRSGKLVGAQSWKSLPQNA
jgi:hypoxanthine phosphoribosyltransferase